MGYRYTVFGAGRQGLAAVYDLALNCEADRVVVIDPDEDTLNQAEERLMEILDDDGCDVEWRSVAEHDDLVGADVILSCAPWKANQELTRKALDAGVAFCDLGGNPETVNKQQGLVADRASSVPVVPDCGVSPGISNILAASLARQGCTSVRVRCGGLPLDANRPGGMPDPVWADAGNFNYKLTFDPMGLLSEYGGRVPVIEDGEVRFSQSLSVTEPFEWRGCVLEASPTSNNSPQVVERLRAMGVRDYNYMTLRYPGHWDLARGWMAAGFLREDRVGDEALAAALAGNDRLRYDSLRDRDRLILSVQGAKGEGLREHSGFSVEVRADTATKFTAMELTTSWGITMVAHQMASGVARPVGFATPEAFSDGDWIADQLRGRLGQLRGQG